MSRSPKKVWMPKRRHFLGSRLRNMREKIKVMRM